MYLEREKREWKCSLFFFFFSFLCWACYLALPSLLSFTEELQKEGKAMMCYLSVKWWWQYCKSSTNLLRNSKLFLIFLVRPYREQWYKMSNAIYLVRLIGHSIKNINQKISSLMYVWYSGRNAPLHKKEYGERNRLSSSSSSFSWHCIFVPGSHHSPSFPSRILHKRK